MSDLPEPLTPPNCDLQDFAFMPLDVQRLRDSELATLESPEACWAALLLWCVSWHQVPAASLPNDDRMIASYAGYFNRGKVDKAWKEIRPGAMRNWVLCSDDRYYHPVVAEKAITAWKSKWEQAWRSEMGRIKKHNQRHADNQLPYPTLEEFMSLRTTPDCPGDNSTMSRGQTKNVPGKSPPTDTETETEGILKGDINKKTTGEVVTFPASTDDAPPPQSNPHTTRPETEPFPMFAEWEPSPSFDSLAAMAGLPLGADTPVENLMEFRVYWLVHPDTRRTQGQWEHAFIKSLKTDKMRGRA